MYVLQIFSSPSKSGDPTKLSKTNHHHRLGCLQKATANQNTFLSVAFVYKVYNSQSEQFRADFRINFAKSKPTIEETAAVVLKYRFAILLCSAVVVQHGWSRVNFASRAHVTRSVTSLNHRAAAAIIHSFG